jgi:hypothetical protein
MEKITLDEFDLEELRPLPSWLPIKPTETKKWLWRVDDNFAPRFGLGYLCEEKDWHEPGKPLWCFCPTLKPLSLGDYTDLVWEVGNGTAAYEEAERQLLKFIELQKSHLRDLRKCKAICRRKKL